MSVINEHIFEIRYKPNPKILDHRGTWAELISKHMDLSEWMIVENRIDIYDKEGKNRAFVGFSNAGFVCYDSPTANYFPEKTVKFFRFVLNLEDFGSTPFVMRIGIRSRFCTAFPGNFEDLCNRYSQRYLILTEKAQVAINAKLIDIGGHLNFVDKHGNFNTMSGPMPNEQMKQFFSHKKEFPEVGLYYDVDYWLKPEKPVDGKEIIRLISTFAEESWKRHERVRDLILGN